MRPSESLPSETVQEKYNAIYELLVEVYGMPEWKAHRPPVAQLVSTILSQQTTGPNRERAYRQLRQRFPTWKDVIEAPLAEVQEAIRPAGLASQKAPRIQAALRTILHERGELSLNFLAEMPVDEAKRWLRRLKGVGPKTAAIVLLFSLGMPAFPVDTHVHRVTRRLGLIGPQVSADKAHEQLEMIADPEAYYPFHINLIRHGREICRARAPQCAICPLQDHCDYYRLGPTR
ncbi:MAG: endonuclease III [Candidatus Promineifilaceae bacterium]|nr:endonuclease III [Candidatus Promineifilaceae bacterium]